MKGLTFFTNLTSVIEFDKFFYSSKKKMPPENIKSERRQIAIWTTQEIVKEKTKGGAENDLLGRYAPMGIHEYLIRAKTKVLRNEIEKLIAKAKNEAEKRAVVIEIIDKLERAEALTTSGRNSESSLAGNF